MHPILIFLLFCFGIYMLAGNVGQGPVYQARRDDDISMGFIIGGIFLISLFIFSLA
jgi:hypothetical protein